MAKGFIKFPLRVAFCVTGKLRCTLIHLNVYASESDCIQRKNGFTGLKSGEKSIEQKMICVHRLHLNLYMIPRSKNETFMNTCKD